MEARLRVTDVPGPMVPAAILGQNIEAALTTVPGLLSDRLRNPKLVGPPHRMTGIAPEWHGASCGRLSYELTPGAGIMGSEAQRVRAAAQYAGPHMHQAGISVRRGERLLLSVWARAVHEPVRLQIELRPRELRLPAYDSGTVVVDTPFYNCFSVELNAPRDDDEAQMAIRIEGTGELWIDQLHLRPVEEPLISRGVMDAITALRMPILRFPGGIVTAAYTWRHGTGPVHRRPALLDPAFHQDWYLHYDFGTDEYLALCLEQGTTPAVTLNIATASPDEAADWAAYCAAWYRERGADPPLIHWHVGNHPYAPTTVHMGADMYVDVLRRYVPAVRAEYPASHIVAVIPRGELAASPNASPWREAILTGAADLVDAIHVQTYGVCGIQPKGPGDYEGGVAEPREQVAAVTTHVARFEQDAAAFISDMRGRGLDIRLGVAEWNWWTQASHWDGRDFSEPPTTLHGLFASGMIHAFARLAPELETAHFYNLVNCMGIVNRRAADVEVTCVAELFALYRPAFPGTRLPLSVDSPAVGESTDSLDALCLRNADATWLFVTNRDTERTAEVDIVGVDPVDGDARCMMGSATTAPMKPVSVRLSDKRVTVPPLSVVRCRCREAASA